MLFPLPFCYHVASKIINVDFEGKKRIAAVRLKNHFPKLFQPL